MKELSDYDKAFAVVQDRVYRNSNMTYKTITSFSIDVDACLVAQFKAVSKYAFDENKDFIFIKNHNEQILSKKDAIEILVKTARKTSIFLGTYSIKILSKGETLDSLCIEYDMNHP